MEMFYDWLKGYARAMPEGGSDEEKDRILHYTLSTVRAGTDPVREIRNVLRETGAIVELNRRLRITQEKLQTGFLVPPVVPESGPVEQEEAKVVGEPTPLTTQEVTELTADPAKDAGGEEDSSAGADAPETSPGLVGLAQVMFNLGRNAPGTGISTLRGPRTPI